MPKPEPTKDLYEITCWCKPKDLPEDADEWEVRSWWSPIIPMHHNEKGELQKPIPTIPCPECGTTDNISRVSSRRERWST